jgi:hypothetical protein
MERAWRRKHDSTRQPPTASADTLCRPGYSLYDTGIPGAFKQDRNLNGLVCDKTRQTSDGYRHSYTDDH